MTEQGQRMKALENARALMDTARVERENALVYGYDTTKGDSGVPCLTLAAQLTAEAQVWALIANAEANESRAIAAVGY